MGHAHAHAHAHAQSHAQCGSVGAAFLARS